MPHADMKAKDVLAALKMVGELLDWPTPVDILLIGGAAGMITQALGPGRTTTDCDVAHFSPMEAAQAVELAASKVAVKKKLPDKWFNDQARHLNALPDGWRSRRVHVATYGKLKVYAVSRLDFLAMKAFAHRDLDRRDIAEMRIGPEEIDFVRKYLSMLKVPSRGADLDQVRQAEIFLDLLEGKKP